MSNKIPVVFFSGIFAIVSFAAHAEQLDLAALERQMLNVQSKDMAANEVISSQQGMSKVDIQPHPKALAKDLLTLPRRSLPRDHAELVMIIGWAKEGISVNAIVTMLKNYREGVKP